MVKGLLQGLLLILGIFLLFGLLWYFSGGPNRTLSHEGILFQNPGRVNRIPLPIPSVIGTPGSFDASSTDESTFGSFTNSFGTFVDKTSPYSEYVSLRKQNAGKSIEDEYVTISISGSAPKPVTITGWKLESTVTGARVQLGEAADIPFLGGVNSVTPVIAPAQSTVHVISKRAPTGSSFRANLCTGYFTQYYDFAPGISRSCPSPREEARAVLSPSDENESCDIALRDTHTCTVNLKGLPGGISNACNALITERLTYSGCVTAHKAEPGFKNNEWYLYLGRTSPLFRARGERIRLLDENNLTVDVIAY